MKLSGQNMPVAELEAAMPAFGLTLPSGATLRQGTLDVAFGISGPLDRLVTAGPVTVSNATVTGFDLSDKLGAVTSLAGLPKSGETVIQRLRATVRVAPERIQVDGLDVVAPAIGTLAGAGTIAPKGALDFRMNAKLAGATAGAVTRIASLGQPANGMPFRIQGTTSNPVFLPDVSSAVGNMLKNPETAKKAVDVLRGLFKKKQ
jgi:AsmA protein